MQAPIAKKQPKLLSIHGHDRIDDYYWLNQREDPEVIAHLEAENAYFAAQTKEQEPLRETLFQEIKGRIKEDDASVPYVRRGYRYQTRYAIGEQYPSYVRTPVDGSNEEMVLHINEMAAPYDYYEVTGLNVSDDNRYVAYGEDTIGRRVYTLHIKDLLTGQYLPDQIPNTTGGSVWSADGQYLFYSVKDEALRPYKIMRHRLGTAPQDDVVIYEESDDTFRAFVYRSQSMKYIILGSAQTLSMEYHLLRADDPTGEPRVFQPRERELEYSIEHIEERFYVLTNLNAKNFQLMVTPETQTGKAHWRTVIPHRADVLLEGIDVFRHFIVLSERKDGLTQLRVLDLPTPTNPEDLATPRPGTNEDHYLEFKDGAYMAYTTQNLEFDTELLRFGYQSMTTPPSTYDYHLRTHERTLLKRQPVLGDFDPMFYTSERQFAVASDGTRIPLSIVYHRDTPLDGTSPTLLYAYGSYGHSLDPYFSIARLSLLDRGFVYAIAHIRGGEEMGRHWYDDGKLLKKMNTFTDFIAAGEWLITRKYAAPKKLFAMGGSAGGLLMGAVVNLRPELWAGIVAAVPFVDVVTTMLDNSIPLTTGEYDEWGNPNLPEYYEYILSYSPYDQVTAKAYPPMLVTTGLHDSQVQYWEPAKWVAKLRELKTNDAQILLHTNMEAGHGGASGRFDAIREIARDYAWLIYRSTLEVE
ncbi:S9 family peptidase [Neolewinella lacunae]|uniref:Proline-specific endopeptidase n=1 Tax=Neolewinella lacunae TaxID=1517758 RepID=A0A923PK61_9BACT|nr:S9 family peptidase [Neolewinella lacunae]MBC6994055.1 S9 family peptidase [Neolewinella lacunae]MDN3636074.1 S9 family peptidase [Neolewinella lacunae]